MFLTEALRAYPEQLRAELCVLLPQDAFLRRDRKAGLFVTNASISPETLAARGFLVINQGKLLHISPGTAHLIAFERRFAVPPDFFCASVQHLAGRLPLTEGLAAFACGIRLLEAPEASAVAAFLQRARELAALCLRTGEGGAYACGLIAYALSTRL